MGTLLVHAALSAVIAGICLAVWRLRGGRGWLALVALAYLGNAAAVLCCLCSPISRSRAWLPPAPCFPCCSCRRACPPSSAQRCSRLFGRRFKLRLALAAWAALALLLIGAATAFGPTPAVGLAQTVITLAFLALAARLAFGWTLFHLLAAAMQPRRREHAGTRHGADASLAPPAGGRRIGPVAGGIRRLMHCKAGAL